jgi:hypothetical protein
MHPIRQICMHILISGGVAMIGGITGGVEGSQFIDH